MRATLWLLDPDHTRVVGLRAFTLADGRPTDLEDKMFVPFSILVLASNLVIAVADDMPKFDIAWGCRIDSTAAFDPNAGMSGTVKRCIADERQAKDKLLAKWPSFTSDDRIGCTGLTIENGGNPPSYVELQTCLQEKQLARKLPKE
jgi:hypothetical protein